MTQRNARSPMNPTSAGTPLALSTLARLLFPSWAFFDVASTPPILEVRQCASGASTSPLEIWTPAFRPQSRRWWQLFFNPHGTRQLASQGIVDRMALEIENDEWVEGSVTHQLTQHVAECAVSDLARDDAKHAWQFRIVLRHEGTDTIVYSSNCNE